MTDDDVLEQVLADLGEENDRLDEVVAALDEPKWCLATPALGWDVARQIAHLAWADEAALAAIEGGAAWEELAATAADDPQGYVDAAAEEGAHEKGQAILDRWRQSRRTLAAALRDVPGSRMIPWFGTRMSPASMATARLMETWAHGRDIVDALGKKLQPTDRLRHIAHLGVRTRDFAFELNRLDTPDEPFRVELALPSGETWTSGPEDAAQSVRGSAEDFALVVTQRRHHADTDLVAVGKDAERWLEIAQAFAGPPGPGRGRVRKESA